jgi:carbon-monoxide dehydrogenase medium subunit
VKPSRLSYHAAETADEAVSLLAELGDDAKVLAGGQSLVPLLNLRLAAPAHLVDITRVRELAEVRRDGGAVEIGAAVRQADVEDDPAVMTACPLLAAALPHIAHREIRNAGTVCGSVAHADAAAEIPLVALALDAQMAVRGPRGDRTIPAREFFRSYLTTALEPDEVLVSLRLPVAGGGSGAAFHELAPRAGDYAVAGAGVTLTVAGGVVQSAGIALLAVDSVPVRATAAEEALIGRAPDDDAIAAAARAAAADLDPPTDLHAGAALRRRAAETLIRRAIADAAARAQEDRR